MYTYKDKRLKDKVAIVTGGASGIGKAIVLRMANEGANVVVADIAFEQAMRVASEVVATGGNAIAINVDVVKNQDTNKMAKRVMNDFGKVDILVNNAGGSAREKRSLFCESTEEVWDWVIAINLKGVRNCSRAVIEHMVQRRSGKIINMASISGVIGSSTRGVDYSAAKAGIIGFTKALAKEAAPYGINVNCISPGPIETPLLLSLPEEMLEKVKQTIHLGRLGKPEEIANMVVFLASDETNFITGQNFIVDGGRSLGS